MRYGILIVALFSVASVRGQDFKSPPVQAPSAEVMTAISQKTTRLANALSILQRQGVHDPVFADVQIYHKAAEWIVRHNEFYHKDSATWTLAVLDRGLLRATQALRGESPWMQQLGSTSIRAYRSRVDGSIQPYSVTLPPDYGRDPEVKWRLDIVLHGRDSTISEVKFLYQHSGDKPAATHPYIQIDIFGRGNNAYRWAGETDVLEAIDAFVSTERFLGRAAFLDPARVVLRGFSMGGAGTWHLGLHRPDRWSVIGPGAGFSTTRGYWKDLPKDLPSHVEDCLHIYDAVDYSTNAFNVPVVAYAGEKDGQLQAARNIEAKLKPLNIPMTLLVAPGLEHQFPAEWQKKAEAEYVKYAGPGKGRKEAPDRVWFSTYTLKYPGCDWVEILGLDRHYRRAEVDASRQENGLLVKTANIRQVRLGLPGGDFAAVAVKIDGQELSARPAAGPGGLPSLYLEKQGQQWINVLPQRITTDRLRRLQKITGLQGPIDDAFTEGFLCVRGSGTPWHPGVGRQADARLERFRKEWDRYFRGTLVIKNDTEVTDEDVASRHLILFGDPASNSLIAQVLGRLPLQWTKEKLELANRSYASSTHLPVMIYPSPLNPGRYLVLNSGHTFHAEDLSGTNARLFPRLGDYAIVKFSPDEPDPAKADVVTAGLFDDSWQIPK